MDLSKGQGERSKHVAHPYSRLQMNASEQRSSMCFTVARFCAVQCKHPASTFSAGMHDLEKQLSPK